jgi:probable HAF family extracellular repeat protein
VPSAHLLEIPRRILRFASRCESLESRLLFAIEYTLTPLGDLPGGDYESYAYDISADGSTIVGWSDSVSGAQAFRWTASGGMQSLGDLPGGDFESVASAVSADGAVIAGWSLSAGGYQAFRWTQETGMQGLGDIPGGSFESFANGISDDGSTIVGDGTNSGGYTEAFRWTAATGLQSLGYLENSTKIHGAATAVSANGSIIVGWSGKNDGTTEAFRWTEADGMQGIGALPSGEFFPYSAAADVSADGSVIVGDSHTADGSEAFRWTSSTGMQPLGDLPGGDVISDATSVAPDGAIIIGSARPDVSVIVPVRWTTTDGIQSINDLFDPAGWELHTARGISADYRIVGGAINPSGDPEAVLLTPFRPSLIVNTTTDGCSPMPGQLSLRSAISLANTRSGRDTITFDPSIFTPGSLQTILLDCGELLITDHLTIAGPGASNLAVSANFLDRVLRILGSTTAVEMTALTITAGSAYEIPDGGGIYNNGLLTLKNMAVVGNGASGDGGGIYSRGTLIIIDSNVADNSSRNGGGVYDNSGSVVISNSALERNSARNDGGGIWSNGNLKLSKLTVSANTSAHGAGIFGTVVAIANSTISNNRSRSWGGGIVGLDVLTIVNSTISANTARGFGAIHNYGTLTLTNSTISSNIGGGFENYGLATLVNVTVSSNLEYGIFHGGNTLNIINSTITNNRADPEGQGFSGGGGLEIWAFANPSLTNTLVAGNFTGTGTTPSDIDGPVSGSYNLIGTGGSGGLIDGVNGNIVGINPANLHLAPLANYGGPTETHALLPGSPAVNAGSNSLIPTGVTTDQRGLPRVVASNVDIGALELVISGDLNGDGSVSISDFITLASNFNKTGMNWADGDLNGDGAVTIADFIDLAAHFNESLAATAAVPLSSAEASFSTEALLDEPLLASPDSLATLRSAKQNHRRPHRHHRSQLRNLRRPASPRPRLLLPSRY